MAVIIALNALDGMTQNPLCNIRADASSTHKAPGRSAEVVQLPHVNMVGIDQPGVQRLLTLAVAGEVRITATANAAGCSQLVGTADGWDKSDALSGSQAAL